MPSISYVSPSKAGVERFEVRAGCLDVLHGERGHRAAVLQLLALAEADRDAGQRCAHLAPAVLVEAIDKLEAERLSVPLDRRVEVGDVHGDHHRVAVLERGRKRLCRCLAHDHSFPLRVLSCTVFILSSVLCQSMISSPSSTTAGRRRCSPSSSGKRAPASQRSWGRSESAGSLSAGHSTLCWSWGSSRATRATAIRCDPSTSSREAARTQPAAARSSSMPSTRT